MKRSETYSEVAYAASVFDFIKIEDYFKDCHLLAPAWEQVSKVSRSPLRGYVQIL